MYHYLSGSLTIALIFFMVTRAHAYEMEDVKRIDFEVRDPKSKALYFTGTETIQLTAGKTKKETWYYDLEKREAQYESVDYLNESLRVQSYQFNNPITGENTVMQTEGDTIKISYRPDSKSKIKDGTLKWTADSYHGKVFNNLILRNWKSLLSGQPLKFSLVLPFRFESLGFQIVYQKSASIDGEQREIFLLQPSSFLIRALAPHMEFHYLKGERPRIRQFTGPCTIPIQGEKDKMVDILFSYPKP